MYQRGASTLVGVFWLFFIIVFGIGWIRNILDIISMLDGPVTAMFIFRCIGIFVFPLGGVLGYM